MRLRRVNADSPWEYYNLPEQIDDSERLLNNVSGREYTSSLEPRSPDTGPSYPRSTSSVYSLTETYAPDATEARPLDTFDGGHNTHEPFGPYGHDFSVPEHHCQDSQQRDESW